MYWQIFAAIIDGKVKGIGLIDPNGNCSSGEWAKATYGADAFAVEVTNIPVQIGDVYTGYGFVRDGVAVKPIPTVDEQINSLNDAVNDLIVEILEG